MYFVYSEFPNIPILMNTRLDSAKAALTDKC